jgi:site-specific recombinase XerD
MSTTLVDDVEAFLSHGKATGLAESTVRHYRQLLEAVLQFLRRRGCKRAPEVTAEDLDALMQEQVEKGFAKHTRVKIATIVRCLFRYLQEHGRIVVDPSRNLPRPGDDDGDEDLPEPPLSEAEVAALFAWMPRGTVVGIRNVCMMELIYGCGLRLSEAHRLNLDNVDLLERTVWVVDSKHGQSRLLPLMGTATAAVKDWLALRRTLLRGPDLGAFFLTAEGKRLTMDSIQRIFWVINQKRGPEARHLHPHLLRHSIAVHLMRGGADVRHVQAFLGHADIDTTKVYLRMVPGRLKEDYDKAMPEIAVNANGSAPS